MGFGSCKATAAGVLLLGVSVVAIAPGSAHEAPADEGRICNSVHDTAGRSVVSASGRFVKHGGTFDCPQPEPAPVVEAPQKVEPVVIATISSDVAFDLDKSILKPAAHAELDRVVTLLEDSPKTQFEVVGHADSTGEPDYNQALSERRANAVAAYLVKSGIAADRFTVSGRGESEPATSNETRAGRAINRRVELTSR
jgi:OOP family OmpA-OmpF porin